MYVLRFLEGFLIVSCKCTLIYLPLCCPVATFNSFQCLFFFFHLRFLLVLVSASYPFLITRLIFTLGSPHPNHFGLGLLFYCPPLSLLWVPTTTALSKAQQALKSFFRKNFSFAFSSIGYWLCVLYIYQY